MYIHKRTYIHTYTEAKEVKSGLATAEAEGGHIRKKKRLVEAKKDVLTFIESIAGELNLVIALAHKLNLCTRTNGRHILRSTTTKLKAA